MPELTPATKEILLDAKLLDRLAEVSVSVGNRLYEVIKQRLARGRDETAVTLHLLAVSMILGMVMRHLPNPETVAPQVNALWKLLRVPFRLDIHRVQ